MHVKLTTTIFFLSFAYYSQTAFGGPWIQTGDSQLRHHIQVLADAGVIKSPITSWPLNWSNILDDLQNNYDQYDNKDFIRWSYNYVRFEAEAQTETSYHEIRLNAASSPDIFSDFNDAYREPNSFSLRSDFLSDRVSLNLNIQAYENAADDKQYRFNNTHAAFHIGNWMFGIGAIDRWWSPGWQHSLILSSTAHPSPGIFIKRNFNEAFSWPILNWFGEWQFEVFANQLESDRAVPNAQLLGSRLVFKPSRHLEVGLSRTAQWGGEGRPEDGETFFNLLLGRDNRATAGTKASFSGEEPGNQLGGLDIRLALNIFNFSNALYTQFIGEDEAGGTPSRTMAMAGFETAFSTKYTHNRLIFETADTQAGVGGNQTHPDAAYNHALYQSGYRYYGRPIGDSSDSDSLSYSLMGQHYLNNLEIIWKLKRTRLNRDVNLSLNLENRNRSDQVNSLINTSRTSNYAELILGFVVSDTLKIKTKLFYLDTPITYINNEINSGGSLELIYRP